MRPIWKAAILAVAAVFVGVPAPGQERTLQDVARDLKLKKDRKPGTFSVVESTVPTARPADWDQVRRSNEAYLNQVRNDGLARRSAENRSLPWPPAPPAMSPYRVMPLSGSNGRGFVRKDP